MLSLIGLFLVVLGERIGDVTTQESLLYNCQLEGEAYVGEYRTFAAMSEYKL